MKDINILKNNNIDIDTSLEILGDIEMYDETLNDFLDGIENKISLLKEYKTSSDMPNYAIYAHSVKSDAKYLGFTILAETAFNHEIKAKENNSEYINNHFDDFINEITKTINISKEYLEIKNL